jgi:xanthine dehydrogenase YagR molybdenum-binding subunit
MPVDDMVGGSRGEKVMYAMWAELIEVRVHAVTREIRVPRVVGAFAAGRLMNTRTVHSQLMGGMIWGISSALHEATEIDSRYARYVNVNLASGADHDVNPVGVKGLGELANVGTAAAIANAIPSRDRNPCAQIAVRLEKLLQA